MTPVRLRAVRVVVAPARYHAGFFDRPAVHDLPRRLRWLPRTAAALAARLVAIALLDLRTAPKYPCPRISRPEIRFVQSCVRVEDTGTRNGDHQSALSDTWAMYGGDAPVWHTPAHTRCTTCGALRSGKARGVSVYVTVPRRSPVSTSTRQLVSTRSRRPIET